MNTATIVVGLVVAIVLIAAAYFSIRYLKGGDCDGCRGCEKEKKR